MNSSVECSKFEYTETWMHKYELRSLTSLIFNECFFSSVLLIVTAVKFSSAEIIPVSDRLFKCLWFYTYLWHRCFTACCIVIRTSLIFIYFKVIKSKKYWGGGALKMITVSFSCKYRVCQEECSRLREGVPYVKLYRYNPKHLYPKLNGYGDNGQRSLKLWQLLHTYWLPNTY